MLGIDNQNSDEMMALLEKANADAKERAEKTAKTI
jgi:type III secretory pathway lipoprotein EscJ